MKTNASKTHVITLKLRGWSDGYDCKEMKSINPRKVWMLEKQPINAKTGKPWQATKTVGIYEISEGFKGLRDYHRLLKA